MNSILKQKKLWLLGAAAVMTVSLSVGSAMAYFTTNSEASGRLTVHMGGTETRITEDEPTNYTKHVVATNTGSEDCYIRAKAFCGSDLALTFGTTSSWYDGGDGYWYYPEIVAPGESTEGRLEVLITAPEGYTHDVNVAVITECVPVTYDSEGNPEAADWDSQYIDINADNGTIENGGEQ